MILDLAMVLVLDAMWAKLSSSLMSTQLSEAYNFDLIVTEQRDEPPCDCQLNGTRFGRLFISICYELTTYLCVEDW